MSKGELAFWMFLLGVVCGSVGVAIQQPSARRAAVSCALAFDHARTASDTLWYIRSGCRDPGRQDSGSAARPRP